MRGYRQRNQNALESLETVESSQTTIRDTTGVYHESDSWFEEQVRNAKDVKAQKMQDLAKYREIENKRDKTEEEWDLLVQNHYLVADD